MHPRNRHAGRYDFDLLVKKSPELEAIAYLNPAGEPTIDFTGQFHRIDRAGVAPRPTRSIPIWCGGGSEVSLRRAARVADGFSFVAAGKRTAEQAEMLKGFSE